MKVYQLVQRPLVLLAFRIISPIPVFAVIFTAPAVTQSCHASQCRQSLKYAEAADADLFGHSVLRRSQFVTFCRAAFFRPSLPESRRAWRRLEARSGCFMPIFSGTSQSVTTAAFCSVFSPAKIWNSSHKLPHRWTGTMGHAISLYHWFEDTDAPINRCLLPVVIPCSRI